MTTWSYEQQRGFPVSILDKYLDLESFTRWMNTKFGYGILDTIRNNFDEDVNMIKWTKIYV